MNSLKTMLGGIYHFGLRLDRKLSPPKKIPGARVISVGNIAVGGRAKTPFVIYLCRGLRDRGYQPVVLTRGYGRQSSSNVFLGASDSDAGSTKFNADNCGDEALEIWSKTHTPVLVGSDRYQNAVRFLNESKTVKNPVFVLDDGFQHWSLRRNLDIVIVHPEDYHSRLLPLGRLREPPSALQRADIIFELGRDLHKLPQLAVLQNASRVEPTLLLTTRAPDKSFEAVMSQYFQSIRIAALPDHARRERIMAELGAAPERQVVIGGKEAVKIVTDRAALEKLFESGRIEMTVAGKTITLFYVSLALKLENEPSFWERVLKKLGAP